MKTHTNEVVEEFEKKWMICLDEGGFMKENRHGIEFYVVKDWLEKALTTAREEEREKILKVAEDYMNTSDWYNFHIEVNK